MIMNALNLLWELIASVILAMSLVLIPKVLPAILRPLPLTLKFPRRSGISTMLHIKMLLVMFLLEVLKFVLLIILCLNPILKKPFPDKVKEYSMIISANSKGTMKTMEPGKHLSDEPVVAIVKDTVTRNIEDEHIVFCEDASNIISHPGKTRKASVPVLSVRIGDHCYYGLCDIGASSSAIPYELYREIYA